jgi:hypothetical protein
MLCVSFAVEDKTMDPSTWISAVTALGGLVKAWIDARKSGIDLEKAKVAIAERSQQSESLAPKISKGAKPAAGSSLVIDQELLGQLIVDINACKKRFAAAFNDPRYTPADIDREEERARLSVCTHIARIRQFNAGKLPSMELENLSQSFRCGG